MNAPLPAQPCGKPVCPRGQRFGPRALPGHSGYSWHRCFRAFLRQSAKAREAAAGAGHPETGQAGRQRRVPPGPPPCSEEYLFIPSGAAPSGEAPARPWAGAFSARLGLRGGGAQTAGGPCHHMGRLARVPALHYMGGTTVFWANQARAVPTGTGWSTMHPVARLRSPLLLPAPLGAKSHRRAPKSPQRWGSWRGCSAGLALWAMQSPAVPPAVPWHTGRAGLREPGCNVRSQGLGYI